SRSDLLREGRVSANAASALAAGQTAGRCRLPGQSGAGATGLVWRAQVVLAGGSIGEPAVRGNTTRGGGGAPTGRGGRRGGGEAAPTGSAAACGGERAVCKDGLDRVIFLCSIRNLPFGPSDEEEFAKLDSILVKITLLSKE